MLRGMTWVPRGSTTLQTPRGVARRWTDCPRGFRPRRSIRRCRRPSSLTPSPSPCSPGKRSSSASSPSGDRRCAVAVSNDWQGVLVVCAVVVEVIERFIDGRPLPEASACCVGSYWVVSNPSPSVSFHWVAGEITQGLRPSRLSPKGDVDVAPLRRLNSMSPLVPWLSPYPSSRPWFAWDRSGRSLVSNTVVVGVQPFERRPWKRSVGSIRVSITVAVAIVSVVWTRLGTSSSANRPVEVAARDRLGASPRCRCHRGSPSVSTGCRLGFAVVADTVTESIDL